MGSSAVIRRTWDSCGGFGRPLLLQAEPCVAGWPAGTARIGVYRALASWRGESGGWNSNPSPDDAFWAHARAWAGRGAATLAAPSPSLFRPAQPSFGLHSTCLLENCRAAALCTARRSFVHPQYCTVLSFRWHIAAPFVGVLGRFLVNNRRPLCWRCHCHRRSRLPLLFRLRRGLPRAVLG